VRGNLGALDSPARTYLVWRVRVRNGNSVTCKKLARRVCSERSGPPAVGEVKLKCQGMGVVKSYKKKEGGAKRGRKEEMGDEGAESGCGS